MLRRTLVGGSCHPLSEADEIIEKLVDLCTRRGSDVRPIRLRWARDSATGKATSATRQK